MSTLDRYHTGVHNAFIRHVGVGRRFRVADIAKLVGKSTSLVQKWQEGVRAPCAGAFLKLCDVLGPAFTNHALSAVNQGGVQSLDTDPVCPRAALAASAEATSFVASAVSEGVITENKRMRGADLADRAARMMRAVRAGRCG